MNAAVDHLRAAAGRLIEDGRSEGIEPDGPLGRWLEGQAVALGALADIVDAQSGRIETMVARVTAAADAEIAKVAAATSQAEQAVRAGEVALRQARTAQIALQVEQESLVVRMVKETLPLFVDKLQGALVLREQRWNEDVRRRRYALAGLVTLGLFLGGYAFCAWENAGANSALDQCMAHPLEANGHIYCDISSLWRGRPR